MTFQFPAGGTPNKTTSSGVLSFTPPAATQATGSLGGTPGMTSGLSGFALGSGDAKSTALSFTPMGTTTTASGQRPTGFTLPTSASAVAPSSAAPTVGFNLAATTTPVSVGVAASSGATPLFSSQPAGSLKLGTPSAVTTTTAATTTTASAIALQPAAQAQATSAASLVSSTTVTSSAPVTGVTPSSMNFVQLEEIINKWTLELEEQEKMFINQATQVNAWDRLLVGNSEKIVGLNNSVENVKLQQQQLDYELDFILAQQRELEECLVPLEKELASAPVNIDPQREHMYHMAENLDTQLKQMSEDLKEIIDHLNESSKTQDNDDPIIQIGKILDAHMNSLQWIDEHVLQIQNKLDEVSKLHDLHRRENERSFRLTYDYSGI